MASQFFLEIGTEELPARFVQPALDHLAPALSAALDELHITYGEIHAVATPRRLTVWFEGVAEKQDDREEVVSGPPARIAFDADGNPTRAAEGFARKTGVDVGDLFKNETAKGEYVCARVFHKGKTTHALLVELLPGLIDAIPFKKSMRWGYQTVSFGRPVRWICALFGGEVIPFEYADVKSGNTTCGHRIMAPEPFEVHDAAQYLKAIREAHVVVDAAERRATINKELAELAIEAGGNLVEDDALVHEVANLTENPWCGLVRFDVSNLALPREVLISSMRKHQRYFAFEDSDGALLPVFGVFSNTWVRDRSVVLRGNERVLKARLHDGAFFFAEDRKRTLADRIDELKRVTFLGALAKIDVGDSLYERTSRLAALAGAVAKLAYPDQEQVHSDASRAAQLSKTDLATLMVGEFPDLQGIIGSYYARADGEGDAVADAIGEQYRPRNASDQPATTPAGICLALADKLEKIAACFAVSLIPGGSRDPYGLRRAALGVLRTLEHNNLDLDVQVLVHAAVEVVLGDEQDAIEASIIEFFEGRIRAELTSHYRTDIVDAVMAAGFNRPIHVRQRVVALADIAREADLTPIGEAFKRIKNILQRNADAISVGVAFDLERAVQDEEKTLGALANTLQDTMRDQLAGGHYRDALSNLTKLRDPLEDFFNEVMVMADDQELRTNRLALLQGLRHMFETVADVSRIHVGT